MSRGALVTATATNALREINQDASKLALARDRVAQAYMGHWGGDATIEKVRRRVHWITSVVRGSRVLDVGTSEGIVPILLGREGFHVSGIDISAEALEYANQLLEQEPEAVRERVSFRNISLFQQDGELTFDTVILGEVIEHVSNVENFVARALAALAPGGRLVLTTPFGVHPDRDHKHTFFLSDMQALFAQRGRIEHLAVEDGYIRLLLCNEEAGQKARKLPALAPPDVLALTEEATFASQSLLWRQIDQAGQRIEALQRQAEEADLARAEADELRARHETLQQEMRQQEAALLRARGEQGEARERAAALERSLAEVQQQLQSEREALRAAERQRRLALGEWEEAQAESLAARDRLAELERLLDERAGQLAEQEAILTEWAEECERLEADKRAAEQRAAAAQAELEAQSRGFSESLARAAGVEQELSRTRERLAAAEAEQAQALSRLEESQAVAARQAEELQALRRRAAELEAQSRDLSESLARVAGVEQELSRTRERLAAAEAEQAQALSRLEESQAETARQAEELQALRGRVAELEAQSKALSQSLAQAQAAEREGAQRLAARDAALAESEKRLSDQAESLESRSRDLEAARAAQQRLESESQDLRARLEATNGKHREALRELAALKAAAAQQVTVVDGERLRWVEPLLELFRRLELEPRKLANLSTEIAKERYRDDPFAMLLLASLADALDPQPARRKWLGFRMVKADLPDAAEQVLTPLQGKLPFSPSEQKAWEELVRRPKPSEWVEAENPACDTPGARSESDITPALNGTGLACSKRLAASDESSMAHYAQNYDGVAAFENNKATPSAQALQSSLKLPEPKPSTELLFPVHTEPMVRALKGERSEFVGQPAPAEPPKPVAEATPLKRYTEQPTLSVVKDAKSGAPVPEKEDIVVAAGQHFEIKQEVVAGEEYSLSVTCIANRANPKGAVADVTFLDEGGNTLPKPYPGMAKSKAFGAYFYVETQETEGAKTKTYTFTAPEKAASISVKLVAFGVNPDMKLVGDYRLISTKERMKDSAEGAKYIEFFEEILLEAADIPDSNGSEYFTKHDFRVGVIGDVYMYNFYKDVFTTVHYLSPSNYLDVLAHGLDIVIYTTCWKGINNEEWRGVKYREKPKKALDAILVYAKENNIKTIFQTIEDPSNFDYFLPVAEKFEYIITTDTDCIERYKEELGHDRVFFGEYGVNPQLNNPIGCRRHTRNAAFFAGSYPKRYKERCEDMETIFDSIVESGGELLIADRNFGADSEDLVYPARFQSSVLPPVEHSVLQKLHKLFRYNLNFNSIKQSPTMCAMRVYELQAQGNGFISNYANSVFNKFPGIRIVPFKQNMRFDFGKDETWEEYQINVRNIREVLNSKASYQVVSTLLSNIGLSSEAKRDTTIAVICNKKIPAIVQAFEAQSYPDKVLLEEKDMQRWDDVKEKHQIGYFCWFSESNSYGKHYLNDLLNGFKYTDCCFITKNSYFDKKGRYVDGAQHEYTTQCSGKGLSLFSAHYLSPSELAPYGIDVGFGFDNGYSIDPFEVNFVAYMQRHSSKVTSYQLSVIVPVYNNGRFLVTKCIPSLQRNHLWPEMEILLVDDGSTDHDTLETLEYVEALYPNVRIKFNHDGGSGSASRPRNQGIDMASAPLVTFLDPDNEIAPGAYDLLMELYHEANKRASDPVEFISGFHVKVGEDIKTIGKHTQKRLSIIKDAKREYLDRGRFPVIATQSAVLLKEFLDENEIRFVERSAGQDTLFGWELIGKTKCAAFSGDAYIIYYSDRSDSITNKINKEYFDKKLILEQEQVQFLKRGNVFELFVENRFDVFFKDWYLAKLKYVTPQDYDASVSVLREICDLYGKNLNNYIEVGEA